MPSLPQSQLRQQAASQALRRQHLRMMVERDRATQQRDPGMPLFVVSAVNEATLVSRKTPRGIQEVIPWHDGDNRLTL